MMNLTRKWKTGLIILSCTALINSAGAATTTLPTSADIIATGRLVNDYWLDNATTLGSDLLNAEWNMATYYAGNQRFYEITGEQDYLDQAVAWGVANQWLRSEKSRFNGDQVRNDEDPDNHCCGQTYIDLYNIDPQPVRIADIIRLEDYIVSQPSDGFLSWIDTIFMQAPTMAKLSTITNSAAYSDKLWDMYVHTRDSEGTVGLFDPTEGLWYRDSKYIYPAKTTSGGNKVFWARGNGWTIAGLVRAIDALPASDPHRAEYISMVQTMAAKLITIQQPDGFWRSSLLEPTQFDMPETSGTSFYTYAIAWCINNGYLDRETYLPYITRAWNGLTTEALHPDGFLGYVQLVAAEPGPSYYADTKAYGVGAFLLAASEMSLIAGDTPEEVPLPEEPAVSEVLYRQPFYMTSPDKGFEEFGWTALVTGATSVDENPDPIFDADKWKYAAAVSSASGAPDNGEVNATWPSNTVASTKGYGFYTGKNPDGYDGLSALFYVTIPTNTTVDGLEKLSLEQKNDNTDSIIRFAIQIGTQWYASADNFGGQNANWTLKEMTGDFSVPSRWVELTVVSGPGGEITLESTPATALTGTITGYGLYATTGNTPEAGDHMRFDNFQVKGFAASPDGTEPIIDSYEIGAGTSTLSFTGAPSENYIIKSSTALPDGFLATVTPTSATVGSLAGNVVTTDATGHATVLFDSIADVEFYVVETAP